MPRPKIEIDMDDVERLRREGLGAGRIAVRLGVSKSSIVRRLREGRSTAAGPGQNATDQKDGTVSTDAMQTCREPGRRAGTGSDTGYGTAPHPSVARYQRHHDAPRAADRAVRTVRNHAARMKPLRPMGAKRRRRDRVEPTDAIAHEFVHAFDELDRDLADLDADIDLVDDEA